MFNVSRKLTLFITLLASMCLFMVSFPAQAASITLSPPKYEFTIDKGGTVGQSIAITNGEDKELVLEMSKADFVAEGEAGKARFIEGGEGSNAFSVSSWITIPSEPVVVPPLGRVSVPFSIAVPSDAEAGGHFGTIFFSPVADAGGDVAIRQKVGTLILVRVSGQIEESADLTLFGTFSAGTTDTDFSEAKAQAFFSKFPAAFAVRIQNTGNVHVKPQGSITLKNMFGKPIARVGEELVLNPAGAVTGTKLVDYIPVNDGAGNVLPNSSRVFVQPWNGYGSQVIGSENTRHIVWNGVGFGRYTAELDLGYGSTRFPVSTIHFWIIPWFIILPFLVALAAVILLFRVLRKRSRERLKRQLREEIIRDQSSSMPDEYENKE